MPPSQVERQTLYEVDYLRWIETTVEKLRSQDYADVDWENLIEEIEDLGRSERRSLESNLIVVLLHLLKWQYQRDRRSPDLYNELKRYYKLDPVEWMQQTGQGHRGMT
ncbi:MAG: DUF29 domain-containing protein [Cyanobacteriota bacterium]